MDKPEHILGLYVAHLRVIGLIHINNHWTCKGDNFYGNHLLFERIYKSAVENADQAAEKCVGLFSSEVLDFSTQAQMIAKLMETSPAGDPLSTSLAAEKKFLELSERVYQLFEDEGLLTLGLSDMIAAISDSREEAVYLLKQASGNKTTKESSMNSRMAARKTFLKRMAQAAPVAPGTPQAVAPKPEEDKATQERQAFAALKTEINIALTTLLKGKPASFKTRAERTGGNFDNYNFSVIVMKDTPEAAAANALGQMLPSLINKIPFFQGKVPSADIIVMDS
jgi:DNA-binding ferritin-like protein